MFHVKHRDFGFFRPGIVSLEVLPITDGRLTATLFVREDAEAKAKPLEVIQALFELEDDQLPSLHIYKQEAFVRDVSQYIPIMQHRPHEIPAYEVQV